MNKDLSRKEDRFLQNGSDPDIIERKSGGGCLSPLGIPFLLAGLWGLLIGLALVWLVSSPGSPRELRQGISG